MYLIYRNKHYFKNKYMNDVSEVLCGVHERLPIFLLLQPEPVHTHMPEYVSLLHTLLLKILLHTILN